MTEVDENRQFLDTADAFIDLANEQCSDRNNALVNASFLYGAARFSAFITATAMGDLQKYEADIPDAIDYYSKQFRSMLEEHFEQYKSVFNEAPRYEHLMKKQDQQDDR